MTGGSVSNGRWRFGRLAPAFVLALAVITGCTATVSGSGSLGAVPITVQGDSHGAFDTVAKHALSDVINFWETTYPKVSGGRPLPPLRGKLYSVDGSAVLTTRSAPSSARPNACLREQLAFIIDNAAYCQLDDSIIWDRSPQHLVPVLTREYGPALAALVFAHEFGHAVQERLGITGQHLPTIDLESQADCAAGAFAAAALAGRTTFVHLTPASLDRALDGYFQVRDSTPDSPQDISHGNGFDRINALQQGMQNGATYCFGRSFLHDRTFTERPYVNDQDYLQGGNLPLAEVVASDGPAADLNRFWSAAATARGTRFHAVTLTEAAHPPCATSPAAAFGYCPGDNTVYYSNAFAAQAYNSITTITVDPSTGDVALARHQPADFALGELISIAWGMAARHQFGSGSISDRTGLLAAVCYSGAYAEDINRATYDSTHKFILSPPDMDEATSAVLNLVGRGDSFGARGTSGLERVQAFVSGYTGGLDHC